MSNHTSTARRNALYQYGCEIEEVLSLNGGLSLSDKTSAAQKYRAQRWMADKRGIDWEFTFPSWCAVWFESGKWEQRGVLPHQYCMARHGDVGPYSPSNVSIVPSAVNFDEGRKRAARNSSRPRGYGRGWTFKEGYKRPYIVVIRGKYIGSFSTPEEAEREYKRLAPHSNFFDVVRKHNSDSVE